MNHLTPAQEFADLLDALWLGELDPQRAARMEELAAGHADHCRDYVRFAQINALMERFATVDVEQDESLRPFLPAAEEDRSPVLGFLGNALHVAGSWFSSPKVLALTVAGGLLTYFAVLAISLAITRAYQEAQDAAARTESIAASAARVSGGSECLWQDPHSVPSLGSALPAGVSRLASGIVELEFPGGARVCIEGPAEFAPRSSSRVELLRGRLVAFVPKGARGFTVDTPAAELIDRGTEFGVEVSGQGRTDLVVIQGEVEIKPASKAASAARRGQRVLAGQAVRVSVDDRSPTPVEFNPAQFTAVRETIAAAAADKETNESFAKGAPIWLGNLFDDRTDARLADAIRTDPFKSVPKARMSLGVERVYHAGQFFGSDDGAKNWDGAGKLQVTPTLALDLTNLGWKGCRSGAISNDAYTQYGPLPDGDPRPNPGSISTRGTLPVAPDATKVEEGIGMQADGLLTFDLDEIRAAGDLAGRKFVFWSERAGINDGGPAPRELASVYMLVVVSDSAGEIRGAQLNGRPVHMTKYGDAWSVTSPIGKPIGGLDEPVSFVVRIPADARYLTLITTIAGDTNSMDHAVWSGACLKAVP